MLTFDAGPLDEHGCDLRFHLEESRRVQLGGECDRTQSTHTSTARSLFMDGPYTCGNLAGSRRPRGQAEWGADLSRLRDKMNISWRVGMRFRKFFRLHQRTLAAALALLFGSAGASAQNLVDVKPSPQQVEWQDLEFGVIIHFGPNTFQDREWGDGTADPRVFAPSEFDPEQWMRAIKTAGARYVVMVAKHHDGFCLWPTGQTDYSVKKSPWKAGKGDVVGEVAASARKYGLKVGGYLSPWDRHEPRYSSSPDYDKYYAAQLDEIGQNYGELVEFWLDGSGSAGHVYNFPSIIEGLRPYQPNTLVFADTGLFEYGDIRWVGNEQGIVPRENWNVIDRHEFLRWRPVEADTP